MRDDERTGGDARGLAWIRRAMGYGQMRVLAVSGGHAAPSDGIGGEGDQQEGTTVESALSKQAARQAARRTAAAAQARLMQERLERDKRCAALGVQVLTALRERDRLVEQAELVAGQALQVLTAGEGVSVAEATRWCAGAVTAREVTRLRRLADDPAKTTA